MWEMKNRELACCAQVDRGVPFSMALSLKEQAEASASTEMKRLEAKEASIKKDAEEVLIGYRLKLPVHK